MCVRDSGWLQLTTVTDNIDYICIWYANIDTFNEKENKNIPICD